MTGAWYHGETAERSVGKGRPAETPTAVQMLYISGEQPPAHPGCQDVGRGERYRI